MDTNTKYCIIIDSFRSHNALAYLCNEFKIAPIHIFSSEEIFEEQFVAVTPFYFFKSFIFRDIETLKKQLEPYISNTLFCFACTDGSQIIKETIDDLYNFPTKNNSAFSKIKNNKYDLYQHLSQPSAKENFAEFVKEFGPSVIKPSPVHLSSGCLDVSYTTEIDIQDKKHSFISKYFEGDEYAVDIVSSNGHHKLCAAWKYVRDKNQKIWKNKVELLDYKENVTLITSLYDQCVEWLDSLEHKHGPSHIEIKKHGTEFFCIEMNFRLNGHMSFLALYKCFGIYNQVSLTLASLTKKDLFFNNLNEYNNTGYISRIYFCNSRDRSYTDVQWKNIESLESTAQVFKHVWPWGDLPISKETYESTAAIIILYNDDYNKLLEDEKRLRFLMI